MRQDNLSHKFCAEELGRSQQSCRLSSHYLITDGVFCVSWHRHKAALGCIWRKDQVTDQDKDENLAFWNREQRETGIVRPIPTVKNPKPSARDRTSRPATSEAESTASPRSDVSIVSSPAHPPLSHTGNWTCSPTDLPPTPESPTESNVLIKRWVEPFAEASGPDTGSSGMPTPMSGSFCSFGSGHSLPGSQSSPPSRQSDAEAKRQSDDFFWCIRSSASVIGSSGDSRASIQLPAINARAYKVPNTVTGGMDEMNDFAFSSHSATFHPGNETLSIGPDQEAER